MLELIKKYPFAALLSLLFHLMLIAFLLIKLDLMPTSKPQPVVETVKATVIDENKVQQEIKALEERKKQKELAEKKRLDDLKKQREAEEKRLEDLKQKQEQERQKAEADRQARLKAEAEAKKQAEAEKQKKLAEEKKRKEEADRLAKVKAAEEAKRKEAERKRLEELEKKKLAEQKKREEEAARRAAQERREKELQESLAQEAEEQRAQEALNSYQGLIKQRVEQNWIKPPGDLSGLSCTVKVRLAPSAGSGTVIDAKVVQGSGNPIFDRSVENATIKASPLPLPNDPALVSYFREIVFRFCPGGC